jgi:hypothetical protein
MIDTRFTLSDGSAKWGLVTVVNEDTTIQRQYRIERADLEAVRDGAKSFPPGVTQEEWESGRVFVSGRPCEVGEALPIADGFLIVNHGCEVVGNEIRVGLTQLAPGEWEVVDGRIRMLSSVAEQIG